MSKVTLPESSIGCPMDSLLRLLMGQWTSYILWLLKSKGKLRYGEIKRSVPGVSGKVLAERLKSLTDSNLLYREVIPENPPQVYYGLTARGEELGAILDQLNLTAKRWQEEDA